MKQFIRENLSPATYRRIWFSLMLAGCVGVLHAKKAPEKSVVHLDMGSYTVDAVLGPHWKTNVNKKGEYVVLDYGDQAKGKGEFATLGLFRFVVPLAAREADKAELGSAYAMKDVGAVQKGLFGSAYMLQLVSRRPSELKGGTCYEFKEPIEFVVSSTRSTKFVRAAVYFPPSYGRDGGLFLIVGLEQFSSPRSRVEALDKMPELLEGLAVIDR